MDTTKAQVLFVGDPRICPQVAYVLDIQNYETVKQLTPQNIEQYRDYQIYVCARKRRSRKYMNLHKEIIRQLNVRNLDDICRQIDIAYDVNRARHKNDFQNFVAEQTTPATQQNENTATQEQSVKNVSIPKQPIWKRILRGMKHPVRAAWHVVLRIKKLNEKQIKPTNQKNRLQCMRPSELFLYVLYAKPNPQIRCKYIETHGLISLNGNFKGCCWVKLPFGNLFQDGELNEIYNSTYARIVKLSSLNYSYCLCDFDSGCLRVTHLRQLSTPEWKTPLIPKHMSLSIDHLCNLCCKSCRTKPYVLNETQKQKLDMLTAKLTRSGWLEKVNQLDMSGSGEVFYSPYSRKLLITDSQRKRILIRSNGTLFNEENWRLIKGKYKDIRVSISVDAATAETYQKLRCGGNFEILMRNLKMLAELRRQGQIQKLFLNFVVQRDNFREMPAFVQLCKSLNVDVCIFKKMNNWMTFTDQTFREICLIEKRRYLDYELWCVLQNPIFKDPIVKLQGLQFYMDNSEKRYLQRYNREQRQIH